MSEELLQERCANTAQPGTIDWRYTDNADVFECRVLLISEPEGGFSAHALRLPGVVSQGESKEEAIANIKDAFAEAIREYISMGEEIPWHEVDVQRPEGSMEYWIVVDV